MAWTPAFIDGLPGGVDLATSTALVCDQDGVEVGQRPATPDEVAEAEVREAARVTAEVEHAAETECRAALSAVLALAETYPYPTPEETAIVDAQAVAALDGFRALAGPPADVVALAAAVVSWRTAL